MAHSSRIRKAFRRWRAFIFALVVVSIVWVVSAMAEPKTFRESYALQFDGIDTARFAVTGADSIVTLRLTSNGFRALRRSIGLPRTLHIKVAIPDNNEPAQHMTLPGKTLPDLLSKQLDMRGVTELQAITERVHLDLARRESRKFRPDLSRVHFDFDGMAGLCGEPTVEPDSITLYGSNASLNKIDHISASEQTLHHITKSGHYRVRLNPVWKQYADLRISDEWVTVYIPTDTYIEKLITLPVAFRSATPVKQINLYPAEVTLSCLVPESDYEQLSAKDFEVCATLFTDSDAYLTPHVARFPSQVRVRAIEPEQIQYIIIK